MRPRQRPPRPAPRVPGPWSPDLPKPSRDVAVSDDDVIDGLTILLRELYRGSREDADEQREIEHDVQRMML